MARGKRRPASQAEMMIRASRGLPMRPDNGPPGQARGDDDSGGQATLPFLERAIEGQR